MPASKITVDEADKLPDCNNWTNRFIYHGQENRYVIAQERHKRHWACNCVAALIHKKCRHLMMLRLPANQVPHDCEIIVKRSLTVSSGDEFQVSPASIMRIRS